MPVSGSRSQNTRAAYDHEAAQAATELPADQRNRAAAVTAASGHKQATAAIVWELLATDLALSQLSPTVTVTLKKNVPSRSAGVVVGDVAAFLVNA
jgi:hypothetical protein